MKTLPVDAGKRNEILCLQNCLLGPCFSISHLFQNILFFKVFFHTEPLIQAAIAAELSLEVKLSFILK